MPMTARTGQPELLAPAGGPEALAAALAAGADAVYLGLPGMNARRGAANFPPEALGEAVAQIHRAGARAYLALNIDLTERETGQAARALELARQCGIDAVLVRDPAFLLLRPHFPEIAFHFSTQAAIENSAGMEAARAFGFARAVLAREMSLAEIRAAAAVAGVEAEVFVQGALCFCVSGRCLLSSWAGGRSGSRGACASPCRVAWRAGGGAPQHILSMRDLSLAPRLRELAEAGVKAFKIEGRLKSAAWVERAVRLYRQALIEGKEPEAEALAALGEYTGRRMTDAYLDGRHDGLTGESGGRKRSEETEQAAENSPGAKEEEPESGFYSLSIRFEKKGYLCRCEMEEKVEEWQLPRTVVKRPERAVSFKSLRAWLEETPFRNIRLGEFSVDDEEVFIPRKHVQSIAGRISALVHRVEKKPDATIRIDLPAAVSALLEKGAPSPENRLSLGEAPNEARLSSGAVTEFLRQAKPARVTVEGAEVKDFSRLLGQADPERLVVALPPVFFEDRLPAIRSLLSACREEKIRVEVNSWGGWRLAREAGTSMVGGPGLPVLNSLAARALGEAGFVEATVSPEAGRKEMEMLCRAAPVPLTLLVFGRPALVISRAALPSSLRGEMLEDNRNTRLRVGREEGLTVLRPAEPFDLSDLSSRSIRVAHLAADLVASPDPVMEWFNLRERRKGANRFNFNRGLY